LTVDIAIVSYGAAPYLHNLLASLRERVTPGLLGEVHVWDNASPDLSPQLLERFSRDLPALRVHRSAVNVGHGPALDRLLRGPIRGRRVLILDSDTEVLEDLTDLPDLAARGAVFAGRIHPDPPQLYAYLCHLLLDRKAYLGLPPFSADGAPGLDFFAAVEARDLPWIRWRPQEWVRHYGQGSVRGVLARGETRHPLHRFAAADAAREPDRAGRAAREAELTRRLAACLAGERMPPLGPRGAGANPPVTPPERPRAARERFPSALLPAGRLAARARRLGLGLDREDAAHLVTRLRRVRADRVLEIGTRHGGALYLASRAARRNALLVTLDLPDWDLDDPAEATKRARTASLVLPSQGLRLARADPADLKTAAWAADALGGAADLLLVDARRLAWAPGVLRTWMTLVRPGGLVVITHVNAPGVAAVVEAGAGAARGAPSGNCLFLDV
jgi:predicted O-methyltransferase YrrM